MNTGLIVQGEAFLAMKEQATMLVASKFLPKHIDTPEKAMAIALKGLELGIPMMQSFSQIYILDGKTASLTELQNYLIRKNCPQAVIDLVERTNEVCKISTTRPGQKPAEFVFTIEDAKKAELMANPSWRKYPRNMLFARCFSEMARTVYPDCIAGISYTPEELGREVNADGEVIDV